jgi:hypothetical protein
MQGETNSILRLQQLVERVHQGFGLGEDEDIRAGRDGGLGDAAAGWPF